MAAPINELSKDFHGVLKRISAATSFDHADEEEFVPLCQIVRVANAAQIVVIVIPITLKEIRQVKDRLLKDSLLTR